MVKVVQSKSKGKSIAPNMALKREATGSSPPTASDNLGLNEAALRKLSRAELQNLAKAHKVKANIKSELIIQQLLSLQPSKKSRPAEDDLEERSRKKIKNEAVFGGSTRLQNRGESPTSGPSANVPPRANVEAPQPPEAGPSGQRPASPTRPKRAGLPYDKELYSGTESEMTEEEQHDYDTPISSRSGTPPAANADDLRHCVAVMRQISAQDATLIKEVMDVRETAAKLRKRANDVRDLVKSEKGRRERVEAYFRYWQEIEPRWDRKWLYGEKGAPDHIQPDNLAGSAEPQTVPVAQNMDGGHRERPAMQNPMPLLSPEEVKRRREEIVSKQEAEQRELEALRRNGGFFRFRPSEAAEPPHNLGEDDSGLTDPAPLVESSVNGPPSEDIGESISSAVVATSP